MSVRAVLLASGAVLSLIAAPANAQTSIIGNLGGQSPGQLLSNVTGVVQSPPLATVVLAWNPSTDSAVAGYVLYEGLASGIYTNTFDVGNTTNATISQLVPGSTYYFALAAYDTNQVQSLLSQEVSYLVPASAAGAKLVITMSSNHQPVLTGNAPAGYTYNVQASQNLNTWSNIASVTANTNGALQFTDTNAVMPLNFYRLQQTAP